MTRREDPVLEKQQVIEAIRQGVIVSVQASAGEPLDRPEMIAAMAQSVMNGGAAGLRLANPENIRAVRQHNPPGNRLTPIIGITKPDKIPANYEELVYITPGWEDVEVLAEAGADVVAMDATDRARPGGETLKDIVNKARATYPDLLLMADISTLREGQEAEKLGFDLLSTTLSGYTTATVAKREGGPDFPLLENLVLHTKTPVILEGRIWKPWEVTHAISAGAFAVVIGSAITRPHEITARFCKAISPSKQG